MTQLSSLGVPLLDWQCVKEVPLADAYALAMSSDSQMQIHRQPHCHRFRLLDKESICSHNQ